MNIQGQWTGTITFGEGYKIHRNKELYFDLDNLQENDNITGMAMDIGGFGVSPDAATISGTLVNNKIAFIKQYSSYHFYSEGAIKTDKSRSGPEINYSGKYDEQKQIFQGTWIIKGTIRTKIFGLIPVRYINAGVWTMWRK